VNPAEGVTEVRKHRYWLALFVVAALVAAPWLPRIPLSAGIALLGVCVGVFVAPLRGVCRRLLRIAPAAPWRGGFRWTVAVLLGLLLILGGRLGTEYQGELRKIAAREASDRAEQQRLTSEANARVESLVVEATNALRSGDLGAAKESLRAALGLQHAKALTAARTLDRRILIATDPDRMRIALMDLTDDAFRQFRESGTMPAHLACGIELLDRLARDLASAEVAGVTEAREKRRVAELAAEAKREEDSRRAAAAAREAEVKRRVREAARRESARKAGEERKAIEDAQREAARKELKGCLDAYMALLDAGGVTLVRSVSARSIGDRTRELTLTVDNLWHIRHEQVRLQDAQALWETWATIASPKDPDNARIKLIDMRGNEVGGSRVWGGSLIWVKDD